MIEKFLRDGWVIVDIKDTPTIYKIIKRLNAPLPCALSELHLNYDDTAIKKQHVALSELFWDNEFSLKISDAMLPIMQQLLGLDVMVQYLPYLRIARPNCPQDNIGYHKDTQYGQTPYELAVHIPFVDLDEKSAIRVISGSHLMPESAFVGVTPEGSRIEKGSIENHMGRPYMPKCLAVPEGMETTPLCVKVGQAAIFSPAIFHGQEVNAGDITRVSCDLRFVNSRAPIEIRKGKVHAGYVPVSQSPVEIVADKYYGANAATPADIANIALKILGE